MVLILLKKKENHSDRSKKIRSDVPIQLNVHIT